MVCLMCVPVQMGALYKVVVPRDPPVNATQQDRIYGKPAAVAVMDTRVPVGLDTLVVEAVVLSTRTVVQAAVAVHRWLTQM